MELEQYKQKDNKYLQELSFEWELKSLSLQFHLCNNNLDYKDLILLVLENYQ